MDAKSNVECECGATAVMAVSFRCSPQVLCSRCYAKKSMRFPVDEEFLVDALTVIARTHGLKATTLDALREMVIART